MTRSTPSISRPAGRLLTLLVTAVLAGLLGMHGLAPGVPTAHAGTGTSSGAHHTDAMAAHADGAATLADRVCGHSDGGSGHVDHADGTCAAAGTASAYTPPPLTGATADAPDAASPAVTATGTPQDGRGPPDLSELQLLRI
ncbi:DUF6153 family protein [Streptomyces sp. NPDC057376]|uniref:DUF6153 family protein n=1 Tax=unclassified Streptomyces TaxID=2593676 RepID=UPI00093A0ED6|nr:DUF6153 family protein [Streptomyces sp. CB02414]OKI88667.1 hypothetical protein AMK11_10445 [Streptomyces sp. CB02414]